MFDVVTIGTATYDVFLRSQYFKPVKDPHFNKKMGFPSGKAECFAFGGKLEIEEPVVASGGGATNSAVTFARQGLKTASVFRVGGDVFGELVVDDLKKEKVVTFAAKDSKTSTGYSTILLSPKGERTILVYRGAAGDMKPKEVPFSKIKSRWLYIVPSTISYSVMNGVLNHAKKNGIKIAMNPSKFYLNLDKKKRESILNKLDVLLVNREEASYLTGIDYKKKDNIFEKLRRVSEVVVMTDGANGVWVGNGNEVYKAGIFKEKKNVDRTGAGDAFGSGFIAGLARKPSDVEYAIRLGSANATSVVEHIGTKEGILSKNKFNQNRWRKITIKKN